MPRPGARADRHASAEAQIERARSSTGSATRGSSRGSSEPSQSMKQTTSDARPRRAPRNRPRRTRAVARRRPARRATTPPNPSRRSSRCRPRAARNRPGSRPAPAAAPAASSSTGRMTSITSTSAARSPITKVERSDYESRNNAPDPGNRRSGGYGAAHADPRHRRRRVHRLAHRRRAARRRPRGRACSTRPAVAHATRDAELIEADVDRPRAVTAARSTASTRSATRRRWSGSGSTSRDIADYVRNNDLGTAVLLEQLAAREFARPARARQQHGRLRRGRLPVRDARHGDARRRRDPQRPRRRADSSPLCHDLRRSR